MSGGLPPEIEEYASRHTTPRDAALAGIAAETDRTMPVPEMMTGDIEARLLEALVVATAPRHVVEVGTFTGHGAVAIAARLAGEARVTTIESNPDVAEVARRHIEQSGFSDRVDLIVGDAREIVATLDGPFDLVFIDAWKPDYVHYYEALLPKLGERGLILADNVLWSGKVVDAGVDDDQTVALREFADHVNRDDRVNNVLLTVGDGLLMIWRR